MGWDRRKPHGDVDAFAETTRRIRAASNVTDEDVHLLLGALQYVTGWDKDVLCRHLGCSGGDASSERVAHSFRYLTWVKDLCATVDPSHELVRSRRAVVVGAFELCDGAGGPVAGRVDRCREAMEQPVGDGYSAMTLLSLGEVAEAWRQAARALPDGPARAVQDLADRHELVPRRSHLHPRRLHLLASGTSDDIRREIGATVAERMRRHVDGCERCRAFITEELRLPWTGTSQRTSTANAA